MKARRQVYTRLIVTSILLLALFMILAAVAYLNGRKVERDSVLISTDAVPGSIDAHALRAAISRSVGFVMVAEMTDNPATRASALKITHDADAEFRKLIAQYQTTIRIDPVRDQTLMLDLQAKWNVFQERRAGYEQLIGSGDRARNSVFFESQVLPAYTEVIQSAEALLSYNHANTLAYAKRIEGSIQTLRWTVIIVLLLATLCVAILASNIVTRRRQVKELAESEQRLRLVLDNLFAHVAVLEPDGTLIEVNQAALEAAKLSRAAVLGRKLAETHWWSHSPEAQARLQRTLRQVTTGQTVRYDTEIRVAERLLTVDFSCGPIRDLEGQVRLIVATAVDISERRKLEEQILRAQRMEAIGALSSGLAHDLNNILAPMLMAAGLLKLKLDSPRDRNIITMIEGGAQRGADIIRQLLTFGRGQDGTRGNLELGLLLKEIVHITRETFPRNIELKHETAAGLWSIIADSTQMHQVLLNLCVNARDAMPRGGLLRLTLENLELDEERAKPHHPAIPGRYVRLTVQDTGEGIPPEIINRIFDPFFTTKPVGKGTGLGLASVLGIVKGHGGFVTVDSEPGEGTTFRVHFPAAELQPAAPHAEAQDNLPRGSGEMILLVDDEPAMRDAVRQVLELHNYRVITAGDGEEAVRVFVEHRDSIKAVVTDLDMPVMSGEELIRSLRVLEGSVRFIVMTGSSGTDSQRGLAAMGINEVLPKPCEPARLLKKLHGMLQAGANTPA
jgi:two-component system cell cycle sensor histidine kinase/response regulator CckA